MNIPKTELKLIHSLKCIFIRLANQPSRNMMKVSFYGYEDTWIQITQELKERIQKWEIKKGTEIKIKFSPMAVSCEVPVEEINKYYDIMTPSYKEKQEILNSGNKKEIVKLLKIKEN